METDIDVKITRGRNLLWLIHLGGILILAACFAYGSTIYDSLPETIPTHWGASSTPDEWADKSFGSVFAPLLVGAGISVFLALIAAAAPFMIPPNQNATPWELWRREGTIRGLVAGMGGMSVLLAALMGVMSVSAWRNPDGFPSASVLILIVLILVGVIAASALSSRWARRTALRNGITPTVPEQEEDKLWIAGGIYNNAKDPRVIVPKRAGFGTGVTVNVGNSKGRAAVVIFLAVFVGIPLVLLGVSAL
ncbi:DUF1648 domain-containing protein [Arthrobacter sp. NPDC097144]|uniref:DUF1648 domain-containing protein n=1 Tax=Arthrobacter sp. NPDC097144 TaxID=3363946 RepID=UPI0037FEA378